MESEGVDPWKTGERSSSISLYEQGKGTSGSQLAREGDTGRMQDGAQESKGLPSGESEHGAGTEAPAAEGLQLGLSLCVLHSIGEAGPSVLDENDGYPLGISYEEEQGHLLSAGKRGSRGGGGRGRGRGRGRKSGAGDTEETNDSVGNDNGKGRKGRGRGSRTGAVAAEEVCNSVDNDGSRGRRGRSRGRGRDSVKPVGNVEPQCDVTERGGDDGASSQQNNALGDEHHLSVNGIPSISGGRTTRANSGLSRMRGQLVRGRGSGKSTGKRGRNKDGIFEADNIRAAGENASDVSDNVLEASMISSRDGQVRVIVSPPAGAKTTEMNNAGHTIIRKPQGAGERAFLTVKSHRQPNFAPDMEELIRIWLSEIQILS